MKVMSACLSQENVNYLEPNLVRLGDWDCPVSLSYLDTGQLSQLTGISGSQPNIVSATSKAEVERLSGSSVYVECVEC